MQTLISFAIEERYRKVANLGDRLEMVNKIIDWGAFRSIFSKMYNDNTPKGGRPHCDEIVMLKVLLLQSWYSLSDQEVEYQIADRISFQHFIVPQIRDLREMQIFDLHQCTQSCA